MGIYDRITDHLNSLNIAYSEFRHAPVRTSEEAAKIRGTNTNVGAKALLFIADKSTIQIVLQGSKKVDKDKFKQIHNIKSLKMLDPKDVLDVAGVEPGGVPPFGNLFSPSVPVYVDENLLKLEQIEFNAGDRSVSIKMNTKDWKLAVKPIVSNFSE